MFVEKKIKQLLNQRGIDTDEKIEEFFAVSPQKTYDPFLLLNMEEGVDLILSEIDEGGRICVYGDYDADGITSCSIIMEVFSHLTDNITYYIPSRFDEGYGLNNGAIKKLHDQGITLIITVDCGVVSCDEVAYAHSIGMKVVVTDHHAVSEDRLPDCPVINPAQKNCSYPFKRLAGCGVAFKLAQAISMVSGLDKKIITSTLDLVALGTVADIVPLVDENRTIVKYGLRLMKIGRRRNLEILMNKAGISRDKISSERISFVLAPNINSIGRLSHAAIGVSFFMEKNPEVAEELADKMVDCNRERRNIQEDLYQRCLEYVDEDEPSSLVIAVEDSHEGVSGIVAGKLKERYYCPVLVLSKIEDGRYKGTGRCVDGVDLHEQLMKFEDYFDAFGGHAAACGFTLKEGCLEEFRKKFKAEIEVLRDKNPEHFIKTYKEDIHLDGEDISLAFTEQLEMMEPCGCGNEKPKITFEGRADRIGHMGNEKQYLRFTANTTGLTRVRCVAFREVEEIESVIREAGDRELTFFGAMSQNEWNGKKYIQFMVEKVKLTSFG